MVDGGGLMETHDMCNSIYDLSSRTLRLDTFHLVDAKAWGGIKWAMGDLPVRHSHNTKGTNSKWMVLATYRHLDLFAFLARWRRRGLHWRRVRGKTWGHVSDSVRERGNHSPYLGRVEGQDMHTPCLGAAAGA